MKKDIQKLSLIFIIITIISFSLILFISKEIILKFEYNNIEKNSYILNNLIENYPELEDDIIKAFIIEKDKDLGSVLIDKYNLNINTNYNYIYYYTLISLSIILLISFAFVLIFLYRRNKKIKKIDDYMNQVLNGNYSLGIKDYDEGEISRLKNSIYKMTIKLKEQSDLLFKEKKYLEEILEDISHQIKTPLTSMYMIQDILEGDIAEKTKKEFLSKNRNQIERIEWLITSLLKMSRLDNGTIKLKEEKVKISELITKAIEPIRVALELKNIDLEITLTNKTIIIDKNWTVEALLNIIKNAMEHTNNKISISSITNPLYTRIIISDNGQGISKKDLPHIFERFYKGNHNKESIGIGLNMSKKIINLQKGEIEVETTENEGTSFMITFYKNDI